MGYIQEKTIAAVDYALKKLNLEYDPTYSPRFRRFIKWFGYSAIPTIFSFASMIVMLVIFTGLETSIGFQKTAIMLLVLIWVRLSK